MVSRYLTIDIFATSWCFGVTKPNQLTPVIESSDSGQQFDLSQLGYLEAEDPDSSINYPVVTGKGDIKESLAICEILSLQLQVPFRRDAVLKVLEGQLARQKSLSLQLIAGVLELLGLKCQLATVGKKYINSIEAPAVLFIDGVPCILQHNSNSTITLSHPHKGVEKLSVDSIQSLLEDNFEFLIPV